MIINAKSLNDGTVEVITKCPFCPAIQTIMADGNQFHKWWAEGELIQNAFPGLSPSDREALMTGICDNCLPKEDE